MLTCEGNPPEINWQDQFTENMFLHARMRSRTWMGREKEFGWDTSRATWEDLF